MRDISWLDTNNLATDKVDSQAITPGHQDLQIGLIAIEWAFAILTHTAIDNGKIRFDASVHINDTLINAKSMH